MDAITAFVIDQLPTLGTSSIIIALLLYWVKTLMAEKKVLQNAIEETQKDAIEVMVKSTMTTEQAVKVVDELKSEVSQVNRGLLTVCKSRG